MDENETFYLVFVDLPTEFSPEPYSKLTRRYSDVDAAMAFIESKRQVHVLLIVADRLAKEIHTRLKLCRHIRSFLVFTRSLSPLTVKFDQHDPIPEIFRSESKLEQAVQAECISLEKQALPFSVFDQMQRSSQDLKSKFNTFLWYQILFHTLKQLPTDEQAKEEMLRFCSDYYQSNPREERIIQQYRKSNNERTAIRWYTRNTFFFKLANHALRTEDMLLVYRFRYWLKLLCSAIECEHKKQKDDQTWTLYSGFRLHKDELERLKQSVGNLISINSFLSTSRNINVAHIFAGTGIIEDHLARVRLHIEVNPTRLQSVFCADIRRMSQFSQEEEVLFSLGSTFRIISMDYDDTNQHWVFYLNATDDRSDLIREHCQLASYDFRSTSPMIYFGKILSKNLDKTNHALEYFHELLRKIDQTHPDLPNIYEAIGDIHHRRGQDSKAVKYYKIEEKLRRKRDLIEKRADNIILQDLQEELEEEDKKTDEPTLTKANLLRTMAFHAKYVQAGTYLTQALQIYEQLKVASPAMSECIEDLAWNCQHNEKLQQSLELQYRRLAVSEEYLPADNQTLSDILTDILHEVKTPDDHRRFIKFCKKKLSVLDEEGTLDKDHPRLIHIEDCLETAENQLKDFKEKQTKLLIEVSHAAKQKYPSQLIQSYRKISIFYSKHGLYKESIHYALNELEIYENILGYSETIFDILDRIKQCYTLMLDYTQAFIYMQIAYKLAQSVQHIDPQMVQKRQIKTDNFVRRVAKYQIELPWIPVTPDNDCIF
ncbi:unnamed protein product [Adineta ricciae]|uniref:NAD(P)(+)--arginine ADP-ribosyltransferase n=1 Tax=Adineta ricciae TaxID=249248 RepID=A0A814X229_ADIRI|nr:unnamed protein product [Adineta ricciae]CAF1400146.1 unnamed protein product [Adineta ricciae]